MMFNLAFGLNFVVLLLGMQSTRRLPEEFKEYNKQSIYSNLTDEVSDDIVKAIYCKPFFSRYSAWNFNGIVWWDDEIGYWCIEISKYKEYQSSYIAETLDELIHEVKSIHGDQ
jgi:hypothetical protein